MESSPLENIEKIADMGQYVMGFEHDILAALGLGSCIAAIIYDPYRKIAILAHIMLPCAHTASYESIPDVYKFKYADVVIPYIYNELIVQGCRPEHLHAKIVGGSHMFKGLIDNELLDIGKHNAAETKKQLEQLGITLVAQDIGGTEGRSVRFHVNTMQCVIKSKSGIKEI